MKNNEQLEALQKILNTQLKDLHGTSVKSKDLKNAVAKSKEIGNLSSKLLKIVAMKTPPNTSGKK